MTKEKTRRTEESILHWAQTSTYVDSWVTGLFGDDNGLYYLGQTYYSVEEFEEEWGSLDPLKEEYAETIFEVASDTLNEEEVLNM